MQHWIKGTGFQLIVIFEGRDAAGKVGTIKRLPEPLNPAVAGWWPWLPPPIRSRPNGVSSARWSICHPLARS